MRIDNEGPQHDVTIARSFVVGRFHVTRDEFEAFVKETGYDAGSKCLTFEDGKGEERENRSWRNPGFEQAGNHPVTCVNWNDAKAYAAWLSRNTGKTYRLLSESEWEYAARAGTTTPFWWGSTITPDQANYNGTSTYNGGPKGVYRRKTVPVGSFQANPFGLHDMAGNVWQWVEDCYSDNYRDAPKDGSAYTASSCTLRVLRGGSWVSSPRSVRAALRDRSNPGSRYYSYGFRLARTLNP
jgi:formylglycine-generating enzyme required for sulfatase activity